jgi:hypothetical protein
MIHKISLNDCLEPCAPPAKVLSLAALDDTVFVTISDVEQGPKHEAHTDIAEISISLPSLLEALRLLANDQEREHLRPIEANGTTRETRLAGERLTVAPAGTSSAVGAITAHLRYTSSPKGQKPPEQPKEAP